MKPPKEFTEHLIALRLTLEPDKDALPDAVIMAYWGVLGDYPLERIIQVLNDLLKTSRWFPRPAEILDQLKGGTPEELAEKAVVELERAMFKIGPYSPVVFGDRAMAATVRAMGGWPRVCEWTNEDWPYRIKEFKDLYASYARRGVPSDVPALLTGINNARENPQLWGAGAEKLLAEDTGDESGKVVSRLRQMIEANPTLEFEGLPNAPWEES